MATVYKAHHTLLDIPVAIKVIRPEHLTKKADSAEMFRARFHREARLSSRLIHPNIVQSREFGEIPGLGYYMVMDYCQGESLSQLMTRSGPLPLPRAMDIIEQIAAAMVASHAAGVIHRDLKPENIMISAEGHVWVLDFGIAKACKGRSEVQELTKGGMMVGTPMYMSPEQAMGQDADARSDLYAMGLMFFEMLTGERPYTEVDPTRLLISRMCEKALTLTEVRPDLQLPRGLERIIAQTLESMPEDRFHDVRRFMKSLEAFRESWETAQTQPIEVSPEPASPAEPASRDLPTMPPAASSPSTPSFTFPPSSARATELWQAQVHHEGPTPYSNMISMLVGSGLTLWFIAVVVLSLKMMAGGPPHPAESFADADSSRGVVAMQAEDAGVPTSQPFLAHVGDAAPQP